MLTDIQVKALSFLILSTTPFHLFSGITREHSLSFVIKCLGSVSCHPHIHQIKLDILFCHSSYRKKKKEERKKEEVSLLSGICFFYLPWRVIADLEFLQDCRRHETATSSSESINAYVKSNA